MFDTEMRMVLVHWGAVLYCQHDFIQYLQYLSDSKFVSLSKHQIYRYVKYKI